MKFLPLVVGPCLAVAGCRTSSPAPAAHAHESPVHAQHPHHGAHGHGPDHFNDPSQYVAEWNNPERDAWQKPEEIGAALGVTPGSTVADLGAGTGYLLPALSRLVGPQGRVIALDVEPAMLKFLEEAKAKEGWNNVETRLAMPDSPGLAPASVDAVVTLNVWHHIENRVAYAALLLGAIKPGGSFVVVDFLKEQTDGFGPPMAMRLSAEEVVAELSAGGFQAEILTETMPRHYVVRGRRPGTP